MVIRRTTYPQVEPRAAGIMTRACAVVPRSLPIEEASRVARHRRARLLVARVGSGWGGVTPGVLEHALALGLHGVALEALLWGAPAVPPTVPEVTVRRKLGSATPFVVVVEQGQPVGAVLGEPRSGRTLPRSVAAALGRLDEGTVWLLRTAARLGEELGWPVAAVGGFVRELLRDRLAHGPRDLDLVVEGDGRLLARRLAPLLGGRLRQHETFLTATVMLPDGRRIDVATARRERYRQPGALPRVEAATLAEDLARRDFSVNALAILLPGAAWGGVLDPTGGLEDLQRGRIRILHPLSFIEDPTRIFRAARFAVRLGFRVEPTTRRLLAAAAALPVYRALSGERLMAELEAILAEEAPAEVLARLGRAGAFRLLLPDYRFSRRTAALVRRAAASIAALSVDPETARGLSLLALSADLHPAAVEAWVARWSPPAPMRAALARARAEAPGLLARLRAVTGPGQAYAALRSVPEAVAAWAYVLAPEARLRRYIAQHLRRWRGLQPLLTGADLKAMGLSPGPLFGRLLEGLRVAQVAGRLRSREEAAAWVRRTVGRSRGDGGRASANGAPPG
ncbi:MAG: CCA tRNA nucleotidyltransferase [Candidatus Rokubacteria bacterium]|nr:CCA tRNA nucleotidyltransferase [Candidatus Rokubacteria bacterium]